MTPEDIPACVCTAHPAGDDKRKWMVAVEETEDHVVWCCKRCTEISGVATIQVRSLPRGVEKAQYRIREQRRAMDPKLLRMLAARKRGGLSVAHPKED